MNDYKYLQPKYRSGLRVFLGANYYRLRQRLKWLTGPENYSHRKAEEVLPYQIASHQTPIYRQLKDVDMWLQENKKVNLSIALKKINGILIRPGESMSYWKLIGKPTKGKGYLPGMVLYYGKFKSGVGGGLCQLSNMIYWMALHTPLTVTERHRHSFDVFPDSKRTQPFGSGATCVYNYRDLVIKNETDEAYQINLWIDKGKLHGEIRSDAEKCFDYKVYEADHAITHEFWGAYVRHNRICRKVFDLTGNEIDDLDVCENHALMMYEPFLENKDKVNP